MEKRSYEMDREAAAMWRTQLLLTERPMSTPDQLIRINTECVPLGARKYSFSMTVFPNSVCTRSMGITAAGSEVRPRVETRSFGPCRPGIAATVPDGLPVTLPQASRSDPPPLKWSDLK